MAAVKNPTAMILCFDSLLLLFALTGHCCSGFVVPESRTRLSTLPTSIDLRVSVSTLSLSSPQRNHASRVRSVVEAASSDDESMNDLIRNRQAQVQIGYQATGMIYLMVSLLHFIRTGISFWSLYYVLAGPVLVAGLSFLLKQAVVTDSENSTQDTEISLQSNTFKRFNWLLIVHSMLSLTLPIIDPTQFGRSIFIFPPLSALWNASKGHVYGGVIGWNPTRHICAVFTDIQQGWSSTMAILGNLQVESWIYMLLGAMIGSMTLVKCKEVIGLILWKIIGDAEYSSLVLASRISRLARLIVLSGMILTLKDGADRKTLLITPYPQVGALIAMALTTLAGYLLSPSVSMASTSFAIGVASLVFATVTGYHALQGLRQVIKS